MTSCQGTEPAAGRELAPVSSRAERSALVARGKVKLARAVEALMRLQPFHAHIVNGWLAQPDSEVGTMGVCWSRGGILLLWSPEFVEPLTDLQLAAVLLHEVHHVVLRHPFLFCGDDLDEYAVLVATEVTVNEFVTLPLPGAPVLLAQFPGLARYESTRRRYDQLCSPARRRRSPARTGIRIAGTASGKANAQDALVSIDSHTHWDSLAQGGTAARLAVAVFTAEAMKRHGDALPAPLRVLIAQVSHGVGTSPGDRIEILTGDATARMPWQHVLRRLLATDYERESTFLRPPRRFPELVGVWPGTRRVATKLRILAAIDTSGSMASATLDQIAAELRVMSQAYDVSVVEFDTIVQRQYRLDGSAEVGSEPLSSVRGRGGTSFLPVFAEATLSWAADGGELSGIVCFTDGCGPVPERPPAEDVIWILTGTYGTVRKPASWGIAVFADTPDDGPF